MNPGTLDAAWDYLNHSAPTDWQLGIVTEKKPMGLIAQEVLEFPKLKTDFQFAFDDVQELAFQNSVNKGWHATPIVRGPSHVDVKMRKQMLIVGEVAEMSEACRKGNPQSDKIPEFTQEEEELADVVLRSMDYAAKEGLRLSAAIEAKHRYNMTRPHKHGGKLV